MQTCVISYNCRCSLRHRFRNLHSHNRHQAPFYLILYEILLSVNRWYLKFDVSMYFCIQWFFPKKYVWCSVHYTNTQREASNDLFQVETQLKSFFATCLPSVDFPMCNLGKLSSTLYVECTIVHSETWAFRSVLKFSNVNFSLFPFNSGPF